MKAKLLILCLFAVSILQAQNEKYLDVSTCPFQLSEPIPITNIGDEYSHPKISPDGTKVIVSKNYDGIYIIDLQNSNKIKAITQEPNVGYAVKWSKNDEIKFERNTPLKNGQIKRELLKYNLEHKSIITTNNSFGLKFDTTNNKSNEREIQVRFNMKKKIVEATDGTKVWDITQTKGTYFSLLISPDKSKVLIHKNDGRMYIYAMDGSGMISCLGNGLCKSWSPDGKYLIYFIDYDKGHDYTVESDLYICTADGSKKWKLTNTPDIIEEWPHWSAKGNKITYYGDSKPGKKDGRVYVCNILKK